MVEKLLEKLSLGMSCPQGEMGRGGGWGGGRGFIVLVH